MKQSSRAERFFTEDEKARLQAATREVESRSLGEIVVLVVDRSDAYRDVEVLGAAVSASLIAFILTLAFFHASLWSYLPLSFLFFFPCWYLFRKVEALKRPFVGPQRREQEVRARADRAFFEQGLYRTKKNTGVLFLLSLFEHRVRILADRGIYEKMDRDELNRFAVDVSGGVRDGRACEALVQAIERIGVLLSAHFPVTPEDTNELPDTIITEG